MKPIIAEHYFVGIGASAAGLYPLQKLFYIPPPATGMAFAIIQQANAKYLISNAKKALQPPAAIKDEIHGDNDNYSLRRVSPFASVERMTE